MSSPLPYLHYYRFGLFAILLAHVQVVITSLDPFFPPVPTRFIRYSTHLYHQHFLGYLRIHVIFPVFTTKVISGWNQVEAKFRTKMV
jgi:hypothetical protein